MTKRVRVENADNSNYKMVVELWDKREDGPDVLQSSVELPHSTDVKDFTIWSERYLIIKENGFKEK